MPFLNDEEFQWTAEMQSNRFVAGLSKKKNESTGHIEDADAETTHFPLNE